MVTEDRSRGQVILIGAIALAFIILGVVVVFNGVLYTETVSSGSSSQSASTADVTNAEVTQSVACLLHTLNEEKEGEEFDNDDKSDIDGEIEILGDHYQEANTQSTPAISSIIVDESDISLSDGAIEYATVTIVYDSHDLSYEQELEEIEPEDCPGVDS